MSNEIIITSLSKDFESIKKTNQNGIEYWEARELMPLLGYEKWQTAEQAIERAVMACVNSGQIQEDHFTGVSKMIKIAKNTAKEALRGIDDYNLSRYACYLIAQNGDTRKPEIALAQTYFAVQTRKQEIFEQLGEDEKRLFIRGEVATHNKELFSTAKNAGVTRFGLFNDAGYRGLYGMPLSNIERRKGIKKGELLDRSGITELAANLFRITQTDAKIKKDKIKGESSATNTHFMVGGKVRQTIKDIGGEMPENLSPERHIKELESEKKKFLKNVEKKKMLE